MRRDLIIAVLAVVLTLAALAAPRLVREHNRWQAARALEARHRAEEEDRLRRKREELAVAAAEEEDRLRRKREQLAAAKKRAVEAKAALFAFLATQTEPCAVTKLTVAGKPEQGLRQVQTRLRTVRAAVKTLAEEAQEARTKESVKLMDRSLDAIDKEARRAEKAYVEDKDKWSGDIIGRGAATSLWELERLIEKVQRYEEDPQAERRGELEASLNEATLATEVIRKELAALEQEVANQRERRATSGMGP